MGFSRLWALARSGRKQRGEHASNKPSVSVEKIKDPKKALKVSRLLRKVRFQRPKETGVLNGQADLSSIINVGGITTQQSQNAVGALQNILEGPSVLSNDGLQCGSEGESQSVSQTSCFRATSSDKMPEQETTAKRGVVDTPPRISRIRRVTSARPFRASNGKEIDSASLKPKPSTPNLRQLVDLDTRFWDDSSSGNTGLGINLDLALARLYLRWTSLDNYAIVPSPLISTSSTRSCFSSPGLTRRHDSGSELVDASEAHNLKHLLKVQQDERDAETQHVNKQHRLEMESQQEKHDLEMLRRDEQHKSEKKRQAADHEAHVERLQAGHDAEMYRLQASHETNLKDLNERHRANLHRLTLEQEKENQRLNEEHRQNIEDVREEERKHLRTLSSLNRQGVEALRRESQEKREEQEKAHMEEIEHMKKEHVKDLADKNQQVTEIMCRYQNLHARYEGGRHEKTPEERLRELDAAYRLELNSKERENTILKSRLEQSDRELAKTREQNSILLMRLTNTMDIREYSELHTKWEREVAKNRTDAEIERRLEATQLKAEQFKHMWGDECAKNRELRYSEEDQEKPRTRELKQKIEMLEKQLTESNETNNEQVVALAKAKEDLPRLKYCHAAELAAVCGQVRQYKSRLIAMRKRWHAALQTNDKLLQDLDNSLNSHEVSKALHRYCNVITDQKELELSLDEKNRLLEVANKRITVLDIAKTDLDRTVTAWMGRAKRTEHERDALRCKNDDLEFKQHVWTQDHKKELARKDAVIQEVNWQKSVIEQKLLERVSSANQHLIQTTNAELANTRSDLVAARQRLDELEGQLFYRKQFQEMGEEHEEVWKEQWDGLLGRVRVYETKIAELQEKVRECDTELLSKEEEKKAMDNQVADHVVALVQLGNDLWRRIRKMEGVALELGHDIYDEERHALVLQSASCCVDADDIHFQNQLNLEDDEAEQGSAQDVFTPPSSRNTCRRSVQERTRLSARPQTSSNSWHTTDDQLDGYQYADGLHEDSGIYLEEIPYDPVLEQEIWDRPLPPVKPAHRLRAAMAAFDEW